MNLKDFKKVGITKTHTIFEHPEGHVIHVSHSNIPQKLKKEMRDIPVQKMADGGEIGSDTEKEPTTGQFDPGARLQELAAQPITSEIKPIQTEELNLGQKWEGPDLGLDTGAQQAQPAIAEKPKEETDPYLASLKNLQQTEMQLGTQEQKIAAQESQASLQTAKQLQEIGTKYELDKKDLRSKMDSLNEAIMKGEINPNRYVANMSTVGKITTAIGLILGGIGAGMTGKENLAFKVLENAIDRDVDAQKQDLNKKNNLLTAYYKMYGDLEQAEHATKAQLMSIASLQSHAFAAQSKSVEAQKQNALLQQKIEQSVQQRQDQFAQARVTKSLEQRMAAPTAPPPTSEEVNYMINTKATDSSQRKELREAHTNYTTAMESLSILKSLMNDQSKLANWKNLTKPERYQIMESYRVGLAPGIKGLVGENRMSDQEFEKFIEPFMSGALTTPKAIEDKVRILTKMAMPKIKAATNSLSSIGIKNLPMPQVPSQQPGMMRK